MDLDSAWLICGSAPPEPSSTGANDSWGVLQLACVPVKAEGLAGGS